MNAPIIISIVVVAALAIGIWTIVRKGRKAMEEQRERLARATKARATVLQVGKSVPQVRNGTVVMRLRMRVVPPQGDAYDTTTVWEVQQGAIPRVQAEQTLTVRIDADDNQIVYPADGWAEFSKVYWSAWTKN